MARILLLLLSIGMVGCGVRIECNRPTRNQDALDDAISEWMRSGMGELAPDCVEFLSTVPVRRVLQITSCAGVADKYLGCIVFRQEDLFRSVITIADPLHYYDTLAHEYLHGLQYCAGDHRDHPVELFGANSVESRLVESFSCE